MIIFAKNMSTATSKRVQTAFRLDAGLLDRLKRKALSDNVSLNSLVESSLKKVAPEEPVFPKITIPEEVSPEIASLRLPRPFTSGEVNEDERLAYILGK